MIVSHDYPFSEVDTDPSATKRKLISKRIRQQIPLDKVPGREDNLVYKVSEGYNLEPNDKTYFDKFKIMDLLSFSKSVNAPISDSKYSSFKRDLGSHSQLDSYGGIDSRYKQNNTAMSIIKKAALQHRTEQAAAGDDTTERISSGTADMHGNQKRFSSALDRSLGLFDGNGVGSLHANEYSHLSLEQKILHGIYKA